MRILGTDLKYKREVRVRTLVANTNKLHRMHPKRKVMMIMIYQAARYLTEIDTINDKYTL